MLPDDFQDEELLTMREAAAIFRRALSRVYEYATRGVLAPDGVRVRLETAKVGGCMYTSKEAIHRLVQRVSLPKVEEVAPSDADLRKRAAAAKARVFARLGIKG